MLIIPAVIIIIALSILQINPLTAVRDNFITPDSQAVVLGEQNNEGIVMGVSEAADGALPVQSTAILPASGEKDITPFKKGVHMAEPEISASSAIVIDAASQKVLMEKNADGPSSIASITKLITALVALDHQPDFAGEYTMREEDRRDGGRINLFWGDKISIEDLFNASLVGSDNTATIALVHALGFSEPEFVAKMNEKAGELGLKNTNFVDPIGLSSNNKSTAREVAKIIEAALAREKIQQTVIQNKYILKTKQGKARTIESTDILLNKKNGYEILGGKTGYLGSAGFCFAGKFKEYEQEIISVVLGSEGVDLRFSETDELVRWAYENYVWP
ncbi:hypothetical protein COT99_00350 [Candidatus Falkowbacteria bacterium CG10_big_fil_rev_8_21_14_0_10_43_10]|uniref:Peptidase S11 D-alanyl-D-alanine carboxypeptidase A N-terminal domain-containing protein n=1 Tax=Candidatus Falkowbacteria bacterium CG10_big_fil_rev_8_21_14_0_10_43_10 TaxID=1974567 RepID=A0A2H0V335_9BACT|nr:MAG: hypothetical protein COT99_00350 [Candidatus Falkowbacteria bacterium CG10_big_fil_rev_8_21_14_0_10_43_10]